MSLKIEILPSASKQPVREGWIRLSEKDFNHYESFFAKHPNIKPESADEIYVKGILEISKYPIIIMRHIDWLLSKDGVLSIDYCFTAGPWYGKYRNLEATRYFISLSLGENYVLKELSKQNHTHLVYLKQSHSLPSNDSITKWTWGICSNGTNNKQVLHIIEQINALRIPECEIIICGPSPDNNLPKNVKVISDETIYIDNDIRIPITRKKNLIVEHASYNNLVILHDRFSIPSTWYGRMCKYGNYFDSLLTPVRDIDNMDYHVCDWQNADVYNMDNPINYNNLPPYSIYNEHSYINGGIIICKKHIYQKVKQNPTLNWGECEDIDFSQRLTKNGYLVHLDVNNHVESTTLRMGSAGPYEIQTATPGIIERIAHKRRYFWQIHITQLEYCKYSCIKFNPLTIENTKAWLYRILWAIVRHFK